MGSDDLGTTRVSVLVTGNGQVASVCFRTKFWMMDIKMDTLEPHVAFSSQGVSHGENKINKGGREIVGGE